MEANNSFDDIFEVNKDDKKLQFISSHTYTNIFNEIPFKNSFSNINNIFIKRKISYEIICQIVGIII